MPEHDDLDPLARALVLLDDPVSAALEQLPLPIWIADRAGRVRWTNVAARALFGLRPGAHFSRFVASESVADARELFARKIEGRLDSAVQRTTLTTLCGRVEAELTSVSIRADETVIGVITLIRPNGRQTDSAPLLPKPRLTPRQQQILELLAHGCSTAQIAATLHIAEVTARNHIRLLLSELRVRSRLEAVVVAFRNDWL